ncbi:hypothetical protein HPB51_006179 [Rhipicephalus microplus]|uniref:Uncharacterized protein n=1 Tax=Rhipicephalus microplus TaxID=6941 RepID=A0A9J6E7B3_RHIMP|nr:hypothetical protein HPB51_006179 [Rhipicephalus microplus]
MEKTLKQSARLYNRDFGVSSVRVESTILLTYADVFREMVRDIVKAELQKLRLAQSSPAMPSIADVWVSESNWDVHPISCIEDAAVGYRLYADKSVGELRWTIANVRWDQNKDPEPASLLDMGFVVTDGAFDPTGSKSAGPYRFCDALAAASVHKGLRPRMTSNLQDSHTNSLRSGLVADSHRQRYDLCCRDSRRDNRSRPTSHAAGNTSRGVILGVDTDFDDAALNRMLIQPRNSSLLGARRIKNTETVILIFNGLKVPNYVYCGQVIYRCTLYKRQINTCRTSDQVGHRQDVCPTPSTSSLTWCAVVVSTVDDESKLSSKHPPQHLARFLPRPPNPKNLL